MVEGGFPFLGAGSHCQLGELSQKADLGKGQARWVAEQTCAHHSLPGEGGGWALDFYEDSFTDAHWAPTVCQALCLCWGSRVSCQRLVPPEAPGLAGLSAEVWVLLREARGATGNTGKAIYLVLGGQGSPPREKKSRNSSAEGGVGVRKKRPSCPESSMCGEEGRSAVCSGSCK